MYLCGAATFHGEEQAHRRVQPKEAQVMTALVDVLGRIGRGGAFAVKVDARAEDLHLEVAGPHQKIGARELPSRTRHVVRAARTRWCSRRHRRSSSAKRRTARRGRRRSRGSPGRGRPSGRFRASAKRSPARSARLRELRALRREESSRARRAKLHDAVHDPPFGDPKPASLRRERSPPPPQRTCLRGMPVGKRFASYIENGRDR